MPDIGGLEAIRRVRTHANPAVAGVPIVVLSALVTKDDIQASLAAGADAFLGKPYRPERLEAIVAAVSGRARPDPSRARDAHRPEPGTAPEQASREVDSPVLASHAKELGVATTGRIVDLFGATAESNLAEAQHALRGDSGEQLVRAMHRMKSSAATLGLVRLAELAAKTEAAAAAGESHAHLGMLLDVVARALPAAIAALDAAWRAVATQPADVADVDGTRF